MYTHVITNSCKFRFLSECWKKPSEIFEMCPARILRSHGFSIPYNADKDVTSHKVAYVVLFHRADSTGHTKYVQYKVLKFSMNIYM